MKDVNTKIDVNDRAYLILKKSKLVSGNSFRNVILIFAGAFALMGMAFYNGYPLVYADTSTYIADGMPPFETPNDRPITYSIFIYLTSLGGSTLWTVAFAQCLLLSFMIYITVKNFLSTDKPAEWSFLLTAFLSMFTGVSWVASQLLTDIFTPIMFLAIAQILLVRNLSRRMLIFLFSVFALSNAMHMSHVPLNLLLLVLLVAYKFFKRKNLQGERIINSRITILFLLTLAGIFTMNSAMSKSKHIFFMGRMVESGMLKTFLEENCVQHHYLLCDYKDSLPNDAQTFVWNTDGKSPIEKLGGWKKTREEFNSIIFQTLTTPKYIVWHLSEAIKATGKQIISFKVGDGNGSYPAGTALYSRVEKYFPNEIKEYSYSLQNNNLLDSLFSNIIYKIIIGLSLLVLLSILFFSPYFSSAVELKRLITLVFVLILLSDFFCSTLANAINRFGCKVVWLIPLLTVLTVLSIFEKRLWINSRQSGKEE